MHSNACIFDSSNSGARSPFWDSTTIPVCFLPPSTSYEPRQPEINSNSAVFGTANSRTDNPMDAAFMDNYNRSKAAATATIESQINSRTDFNLTGFGECTDEASNSREQMIRISFNGLNVGYGEASTVGAGVASRVGPSASRHYPNINVSIAHIENANGKIDPRRVRKFSEPSLNGRVAVHEVLHLLGLHHLEAWDGVVSESPGTQRVIQIGEVPDRDSIMVRSGPLSDRDVQCLNLIASRGIRAHPQRNAQVAVVTSRPVREPFPQPAAEESGGIQ